MTIIEYNLQVSYITVQNVLQKIREIKYTQEKLKA